MDLLLDFILWYMIGIFGIISSLVVHVWMWPNGFEFTKKDKQWTLILGLGGPVIFVMIWALTAINICKHFMGDSK